MHVPFENRTQAGQALGEALRRYKERTDVVVLALPRGGVPVGYQVARYVDAPLDVFVVRKLGAPGQEELAMGAIATGGVRVMNPDVVRSLHVSESAIEEVARREETELERREHAYRGDRPPPSLAGKTVILVDDGLATGATMRVALEAVRRHDPARVIIAVPVAPPDTVAKLETEADEVICLKTPEPFLAIGRWYGDFSQTTDDEVRELLDTSPDTI